MSDPEVVVLDDPAAEAAERMAAAADAGGHIALAGGSTPRRAYELAAELEADWSHATLWFGDERCVPPGDEHSNYAMARRALLSRLGTGADGPAVHRMEGERGPDDGAAAYEAALREAFGDAPPRLDLVLLGLGPDMHTASLFPGDDALGAQDRLAVGVKTPGMAPLVPRITLTLDTINAAHDILFLVAGDDKADAVAGAFGDAPGPHAPASLVQPEAGNLTLFLDPGAAARL
ncbi:MAG TPA: 6-phosphogluconolactonase [Thermoleophilaceae bacterium]|nr:6-phosphogluconolactonase [Thermoleophilaceae bacterium]